eukprot:2563990-Amphidinium_carterae.1
MPIPVKWPTSQSNIYKQLRSMDWVSKNVHHGTKLVCDLIGCVFRNFRCESRSPTVVDLYPY